MIDIEGVKFIEPHEKYKEAIIGLSYEDNIVLYDAEKTIRITMDLYEMDYETAMEYFDYNIAGSVGEGYPRYVHAYSGEDFDEYF